MDVHVGWTDIAFRLAAALLAGGILGYDRTAQGRIAGIRTTILMCLAAASAKCRRIDCNLSWRSDRPQDTPPSLLRELADRTGVLGVEWRPFRMGRLPE